jgi:hypothetical protein
LRKILISALAALTALAAVSVANAQTAQEPAGAELTVTISPSKVGTKSKPKPTKVSLVLENGDSSQTADGIEVFMAKQIKVSTKGLKKCSAAKLEAEGKSGCPAASRVGNGTADAIAGVNTSAPAPLKFNVTAFVIGNNRLGFYLEQQDGDINVLSKGRFKKASGRYGSVLDIDIPGLAREFPPGTFNGLDRLETDLYKKAGKNALFKSTACTSTRELPFKLTIHFMPNPNPPKSEKVEATDGANCRK